MSSHASEHIARLSIFNVNRWFPSSYDRGPNFVVWLGLIACFTTAFIKIWTPTSINRWPEAIATLLFIYPLITQWRFFKTQPLVIFMLVAIAAPIAFFGVNYLIDAEQAKKYVLLEPLARIYLFIPIAWWLGGSQRTISIFLGLSLAGLFYACYLDPNLVRTLKLLFQGYRVDFNILNAQHVALFFSIALIGVLSSIYSAAFITNRIFKFLSIIILFGLLIICFIALIGTQTRAALLALAFCACILFLTIIVKAVRNRGLNYSKPFIAGSIVGIALTVLVLGYSYAKFGGAIKARLLGETATLQAIVNQDWQNIPHSSLGVRVNTWILALEKISDKPLIGYGAKIRLSAIQESSLPDFYKQNFGHFHNSYIEFALGFGLLGLIIALTPFYFIVKLSANAKPSIKLFTLYGLMVFAIMNFFESYLFFWMGPYICTLLCSPILSQAFSFHILNSHQSQESK